MTNAIRNFFIISSLKILTVVLTRGSANLNLFLLMEIVVHSSILLVTWALLDAKINGLWKNQAFLLKIIAANQIFNLCFGGSILAWIRGKDEITNLLNTIFEIAFLSITVFIYRVYKKDWLKDTATNGTLYLGSAFSIGILIEIIIKIFHMPNEGGWEFLLFTVMVLGLIAMPEFIVSLFFSTRNNIAIRKEKKIIYMLGLAGYGSGAILSILISEYIKNHILGYQLFSQALPLVIVIVTSTVTPLIFIKFRSK